MKEAPRREQPGAATVDPRKPGDLLARAQALYAGARRALDAGAADAAALAAAAAKLSQAGDWLAAWEKREGGTAAEPAERAELRAAPEAGRQETAALRRLVDAVSSMYPCASRNGSSPDRVR